MGIEENKRAIQRLVDDVFNGGDLSLIPELVSPNLIIHVVPEFGGHDGLKQHIIDAKQFFPDVKVTIDHVLAEGDLVAYTATFEGTHQSGKEIKNTAICISRLEDGKEVERWQGATSGAPSIRQQLND